MKNSDIEELLEYRKAKASGRLVIIPEGIKDGDTVWVVDLQNERVSSHMIIEWVILTGRLFGKIAFEDEDALFSPEDIGETVFKTKGEAEDKLKKELEDVSDYR